MNIWKFIWRGLTRSLAYTTVIVLAFYLMIAISDPERNAIIFTQYLLLLLFGFICGFAHELFLLRKMPLIARIGIHYGILLVSFILVCIASGKLAVKFGGIVVFGLIFSVLYAVIISVTLLILRSMGIYQSTLSYDTGKKDTTYSTRFK